MNSLKVRLSFIVMIALLACLPLVGSYIHWGALPPGFDLLADERTVRPQTSWLVFVILTLVAIPIWSFVCKPQWFGFKGRELMEKLAKPANSVNTRGMSKVNLPWWFYVGLVIFAVCWIVMWGQYEALGAIRYFMFVPLWWGFTLFLDGIVYYRRQGVSFISTRPWLLLGCGVFSMFGWYYFEYLNFFVLQNWFYPYLDLLPAPFTYLWSFITFSTVWPSLFVWYQLLDTYPAIGNRYTNGPQTAIGKRGCWLWMLIGAVMTVITPIWPDQLFWLIWVGPLLIIASGLALLKVWTPFTDMQQGDWSKVMTIALATLCNSVCWEMWNYWSAPNNPNFWHYNLPYVHEFLVFEMPVLGFSGYLFFGPVCWVCWILCAKLIGVESSIDLDELKQPKDKL